MDKQTGAEVLNKIYSREAEVYMVYHLNNSDKGKDILCKVQMVTPEGIPDCRILSDYLRINIQTAYGKKGQMYYTVMSLKSSLMRTLEGNTGWFGGMLVIDGNKNILYDADNSGLLKRYFGISVATK